ncbi:MAG: M1 family metallopeptidase, partial [Gemmatimonas sp.]
MVINLISLLLLFATGHAPRIDTYARQPLDVEHYRFALTLTDSTDRIAGEATVRMRLLAPNLTTVWLDLANVSAARQGRGMTVTAVARNGTALRFTHADDHLTMTLDKASTAGETIELVVRYAGIPADGMQIKPNKHGDRTFFSDDWPDKAHHWLPMIDHIGDKATMEMHVVAPAHYQVISNGRRIEETDIAGGMRRTVWRESVPIAPWLYALGVARFAVQHVGDYNGVPLETWVFAQDRDAGFHDFAVPTKDAMAFYSEFVGPYSYEKLANVQSNSVSGGMESASAIFYSAGSVSGTRPLRWRNVVIHEIAHQWFGNAVTERDWNDVWLSEGFATYFTLLFIEHAYGRDEFADGLRSSRKTVLDFYAKTPDYRVVHENLSDMSKVTSSMTYQKGSWTLHMLRQLMGDDKFWTGIREYYARFQNQSATTQDFRLAMERASGLDLSSFFQQWLYRGGIPTIEGTWQWDANAKQLVVMLTQTQPGEPFRLPVEIGITVAGARARTVKLELTDRTGRFTVAADQDPTAV